MASGSGKYASYNKFRAGAGKKTAAKNRSPKRTFTQAEAGTPF